MPAARRVRLAPPAVALALAFAVAACGSQNDSRLNLTTPKPKPTVAGSGGDRPVTRGEAAVIRGWADTLRGGHIARAARYFALPSEISNGTPLQPISTYAEAKAFNRALPCGAKVVALERSVDGYVVATFKLTERPGPGSCGSGTGAVAYTAFRIRRGHIVRWIRVPDASTPPSAIA